MGREKSVGRVAGLILVAGIALGLAHNVIGLASRPSRGIAWLAPRTTLALLASPGGGEAGAGDRSGPTAPAPSGVSPPGPGHGEPRESVAPTPGSAAATSEAGTAGAARAPRGAQASTATDPVTPTSATSPGSSGPESPPVVPEQGRPVEVDLATAKRFFDTHAALFIDARDAAEFAAGHIPGAIRLTPNDALAEPERVRALEPGGRPIVTYCEGGTCEASLDLARVLVDAGYRRVLVYAGGFPEWAAAGHPVERAGSGR